jgi:A118 family predicted phage portal protein
MEGYQFFNYTRTGVANALVSHSPLGTPMTADSIEAFEVLDVMFDTFYKEGLYGKITVDVPESAMKLVIDASTGAQYEYFDAGSEIYKGFKQTDRSGDSNAPKINAVPLRIESFIAAINTQLKIIAMQMNLNPGTWSFDGESVKTATEIISADSKTMKTKVNVEQRLEESYTRFVDMIVSFAYANGIISTIPEYEVCIKFDDSIAVDDVKEQEVAKAEVETNLRSRKNYMVEIRGLSEEEAEEEIALIQAEQDAMFSDSTNASDEEIAWIENYLSNNPEATEDEARAKYAEQSNG